MIEIDQFKVRRKIGKTFLMAIQITANDLQRLEDTLLNTSGNVPLHKRFRALFTLKALKNNDAVRIISKGMQNSQVCVTISYVRQASVTHLHYLNTSLRIVLVR